MKQCNKISLFFFCAFCFSISAFGINLKIKVLELNETDDVDWSLKVTFRGNEYLPVRNNFNEYEIYESYHHFIDGNYQVTTILEATRSRQTYGACCCSSQDSISVPIEIIFPENITHLSSIKLKTQKGSGLPLINDVIISHEDDFYVITLHVRRFSDTNRLIRSINPEMSFFQGLKFL